MSPDTPRLHLCPELSWGLSCCSSGKRGLWTAWEMGRPLGCPDLCPQVPLLAPLSLCPPSDLSVPSSDQLLGPDPACPLSRPRPSGQLLAVKGLSAQLLSGDSAGWAGHAGSRPRWCPNTDRWEVCSAEWASLFLPAHVRQKPVSCRPLRARPPTDGAREAVGGPPAPEHRGGHSARAHRAGRVTPGTREQRCEEPASA